MDDQLNLIIKAIEKSSSDAKEHTGELKLDMNRGFDGINNRIEKIEEDTEEDFKDVNKKISILHDHKIVIATIGGVLVFAIPLALRYWL